MVKVDYLDPQLLAEAVVLWTGWGRDTSPHRNECLLIERFGAHKAEGILAKLKALEEEFYSSDARFVPGDIAAMGERAASCFRAKHPDVQEDVVQALAWCYTFDYK